MPNREKAVPLPIMQETTDPGPELKITVATVTYNAAPLLERTLRSIAAQDYPYVEHVIVDGNSTDSTLPLFHRYQEANSNAPVRHELVCRSEPDDGIYDAMNKALRLVTGRYVCFLNAGDTLPSSHTLSHIARAATEGNLPAVIYGDTDIVDAAGHFVRHRHLSPPARLTWKSFRRGMLVCHQAFYARTDLAKATPYDLNYRYSADFDWCVRLLRRAQRRGEIFLRLPEVLALYLEEGETTRHHKASLRERFAIMTRHYGLTVTLLLHGWFLLRTALRH